MDPPERRGAVDEAEFASARRRDRIEQRTGATQGLLDEAAHLPAGEPGLARRRIDRHDATDARGVAFVARGADDDVDDGIGHLALTLVVGDLAEEERLDPDDQLALAPGLVEEDDLNDLAVVDARVDVDHDLALRVRRATTLVTSPKTAASSPTVRSERSTRLVRSM